ncbi:hypothetical protein [Mycoplasma suis]|uniref:Uncharacterized protein n=1 Tax=Mycoplasma suis (strain Illinois) TaxID=768700 RepID=F0QQH7_MYCSL|nr:hypothetical protein [Mycoplasma suis]ADX97747.1 hypothetical protein MSU_0203 [Mycoplasma suis str. Illinois]
MVLSGMKIIPVILGITGVVGGGSFGLTTYLMNKSGDGIQKEKAIDLKIENFKDHQKTEKDSLPISSQNDEGQLVGDSIDSLEVKSEEEKDDSQDLSELLVEDSNIRESYLSAKENKKIIAEYIYRNNEDDNNFLYPICEYWIEPKNETGKKLTPQQECLELISKSIEESKREKSLMWLRVDEQHFQSIFKEYFYSFSEDVDSSRGLFEREQWSYGSDWICITTTKANSEGIVVGCEKKSSEISQNNDLS